MRTGCGVALHLAQPQLLANQQWRLLRLLPVLVLLLLLLERHVTSLRRLRDSLPAAAVASIVLEHLRLVILGQ